MDYISLASGASYFSSPEAATSAAIASLHAGNTVYGPAEGTPGLRNAVCAKYGREGVEVKPAQVLITPGSKQALFNLFTILLRQGDEVVVPTPAWFGFHELMKYSNGMLKPLETKQEEGYKLTPDMLRKSLNNCSRILLLTNPGNPTGKLYSKDELEALLQVVQEYPNLFIVSDEIYDDLTYCRSFTPILSCKGADKEKTVIINGFSKNYAMSGWRIGYLVGPEDLVAKCIDFQASTLSGISVFLQDAAEDTLNASEQILAPMLTVLSQNRSLMQEALDAIPGIYYFQPEGAYYIFPDFSNYIHKLTPDGTAITSGDHLFKYLREQHLLELAPGINFGAPANARMSFAIETPKLNEAMSRLQYALALLA
ncbi:aminotransferase class I/II-fold pyridoxal phosphate-dependent enzyme [Pontibacter sp. MBLB2868]|uniref:aminotransferase class I/II-fold pyridoxal phosphate-dependent enzyme n=1 Tax=Pontibacter sp. MBLB2868 TaxID=3451555 RepID=UPI003F7523A4